jgi:hypothetical protein
MVGMRIGYEPGLCLLQYAKARKREREARKREPRKRKSKEPREEKYE